MRWNTRSGKYTIGDLEKLFKARKLIINKDYQRGFIWSNKFQSDLIISLFKGNPIGSLILRPKPKIINNSKDYEDDVYEIVDGQQRIKTIINFINPSSSKERLLLNSTHSKIAQEILGSNSQIYSFNDLDEFTKISFRSQISVPFQIIQGNDDEIKAYFSMIQQQEEVKSGEIISNMPFEIYDDLRHYFDESINFLDWVGFNNKRSNFLKILLANFGIKRNMFHLGANDDEVIKFAKDLSEAFKNNQDFKGIPKETFKSDIKHSFTFLRRIESSVDIGKGKVRFLRLFLLITNLIKENTFIDIDFLALINTKLSVVNDKETLWNDAKREAFIKKLIKNKILENENEFDFFIKLSNLFSKTKKLDDGHLNTINFWINRVTK